MAATTEATVATGRIGGDLARHGRRRERCDSCGRTARLTFSPLHDAHFCPECLERIIPKPETAQGEGEVTP